MAPIGYIVQFSNEQDYTVYHGFVKLYRDFSGALEYATILYKAFLEAEANEVYNVYSPTKKTCDTHGSAVVFESADYIVWIDCVIE